MGEGKARRTGKDIEGGGQPPGEGIAAEPIVDEARAERAERRHRAGRGEEQAHEAARVLASEKIRDNDGEQDGDAAIREAKERGGHVKGGQRLGRRQCRECRHLGVIPTARGAAAHAAEPPPSRPGPERGEASALTSVAQERRKPSPGHRTRCTSGRRGDPGAAEGEDHPKRSRAEGLAMSAWAFSPPQGAPVRHLRRAEDPDSG